MYSSPVDDKKSMDKMFVLIADIISSELGKMRCFEAHAPRMYICQASVIIDARAGQLTLPRYKLGG